jgi:diguanylate cyclase (GGDEF)-like protein
MALGYIVGCPVLSLFQRLSLPTSRLRTSLIVFVLCLLLGGGLAAMALLREHDRLVEDHGRRLEAAAGAMAGRLDAGLLAWGRDVALLTRFAAFHAEPPDPAAARRLMEDLKTRASEFTWIGFASPEGRIIAATGGLLEGANVAARPWFAGGREGLYLGDVHPAVLLARLLPASEGGEGAYFVDAAAPVVSSDGRILGVVAGHMNWLWAEGVREEMERLSPDRPAPEFLVLGADGGVLLGPEALRGRPLPGWDLAGLRGASGWMASPGGGATAFARTSGSGEHPGLGWLVLARRDGAAVLAPLWSQGVWLLLGTFAVAGLAGLAAGAVVTRFGRALRALGGEGGADPAAALERVAATLRRLRDTAWRDPLTGLLNRAGFAEWRAAHPEAERDCALLMLDLDGFKPINDRLGHAAGDAVLAALGRWLEVNLRLGDCAVRMGGDEFLLCLCGPTTMAEIAADEVSARLQAALAEGLETPMGRLALGCSIGVAILPRDAQTIDAGIEHADRALYEVKRQRQAARGAAAQAR